MNILSESEMLSELAQNVPIISLLAQHPRFDAFHYFYSSNTKFAKLVDHLSLILSQSPLLPSPESISKMTTDQLESAIENPEHLVKPVFQGQLCNSILSTAVKSRLVQSKIDEADDQTVISTFLFSKLDDSENSLVADSSFLVPSSVEELIESINSTSEN